MKEDRNIKNAKRTQGAGTRTEWRNVYPAGSDCYAGTYPTREKCDAAQSESVQRIAVEMLTITRYPIPPHAGEETKG